MNNLIFDCIIDKFVLYPYWSSKRAFAEVSTRLAEKPDLPFVLKMIRGLADHHGDESTVTLEHLEVEAHDWHHLLVAILMRTSWATPR